MSWEDVVKRGMTKYAIGLIEEVMADGKKRSVKEIIEAMWDLVEKKDKRYPTMGVSTIPTRQEVAWYLNKNGYNKETYNARTGKVSSSKAPIVTKYWK